jgi:hypothetical protein
MQSVSPVMPGSKSIEVVYAEHQEEYTPLPAVYVDMETCRIVVSRWRLSDEERERVLAGGDIVLQLLIGKRDLLTPSHLQVAMPDEMPVLVEV